MVRQYQLNGENFNVEVEYIDTSFSHSFGLKKDGHFEIKTICLDGTTVDLFELLNERSLNLIRNWLNEENHG